MQKVDNPIDYDSHDLKSPLNEHVQENDQKQIMSPDKSQQNEDILNVWRVPGEVTTKEQINLSRQISFVNKLISSDHSLLTKRKYPILGTHREQSAKETLIQNINFQNYRNTLENKKINETINSQKLHSYMIQSPKGFSKIIERNNLSIAPSIYQNGPFIEKAKYQYRDNSLQPLTVQLQDAYNNLQKLSYQNSLKSIQQQLQGLVQNQNIQQQYFDFQENTKNINHQQQSFKKSQIEQNVLSKVKIARKLNHFDQIQDNRHLIQDLIELKERSKIFSNKKAHLNQMNQYESIKKSTGVGVNTALENCQQDYFEPEQYSEIATNSIMGSQVIRSGGLSRVVEEKNPGTLLLKDYLQRDQHYANNRKIEESIQNRSSQIENQNGKISKFQTSHLQVQKTAKVFATTQRQEQLQKQIQNQHNQMESEQNNDVYESWTAKSSIRLPTQNQNVINNKLGQKYQNKFGKNEYINEFGQIQSNHSPTSAANFNIHGHKNKNQKDPLKINLEKQEIDNLLKKVRERKQLSKVSDPKIYYDHEIFQNMNDLKLGQHRNSQIPNHLKTLDIYSKQDSMGQVFVSRNPMQMISMKNSKRNSLLLSPLNKNEINQDLQDKMFDQSKFIMHKNDNQFKQQQLINQYLMDQSQQESKKDIIQFAFGGLMNYSQKQIQKQNSDDQKQQIRMQNTNEVQSTDAGVSQAEKQYLQKQKSPSSLFENIMSQYNQLNYQSSNTINNYQTIQNQDKFAEDGDYYVNGQFVNQNLSHKIINNINYIEDEKQILPAKKILVTQKKSVGGGLGSAGLSAVLLARRQFANNLQNSQSRNVLQRSPTFMNNSTLKLKQQSSKQKMSSYLRESPLKTKFIFDSLNQQMDHQKSGSLNSLNNKKNKGSFLLKNSAHIQSVQQLSAESNEIPTEIKGNYQIRENNSYINLNKQSTESLYKGSNQFQKPNYLITDASQEITNPQNSHKNIIKNTKSMNSKTMSINASQNNIFNDQDKMIAQQLQQLPLNVNFEYKNLVRDIQRKIRMKKIQIEKQSEQNKKQLDDLLNQQETNRKLKKAAKQIILFQRKQEDTDNSGRNIDASGFPQMDLGGKSFSMNNDENEFEKMSEQERNEMMKVVEPSNDNQNRKFPHNSKSQSTEKSASKILENTQQEQLQVQQPDCAATPIINQSSSLKKINDFQDSNFMKKILQSPSLESFQDHQQQNDNQNNHNSQFEVLQDNQYLQLRNNFQNKVSSKSLLSGIINNQSLETLKQNNENYQIFQTQNKNLKIDLNKQPSNNELLILQQFAQTEARIYKLYRDYQKNDLEREKKSQVQVLKLAKQINQNIASELKAQQDENTHLINSIKLYKRLVQNFENEYSQMEKFLGEKKQEQKHTSKKEKWDRTRQKINQEGGDESKTIQIGSDNGTPVLSPADSNSPVGQIYNNQKNPILVQNQNSQDTNLQIISSQNQYISPFGQHNLEKKSMNERSSIEKIVNDERMTTISLSTISQNRNEKLQLKIVERMFAQFQKAMKQEKPIDLALQTLDWIKQSLGCQKCTLYPIDFFTNELLTKNISKERQNYIHQIQFNDESDNSQTYLSAISKSESELCNKLIFKSLKIIHQDFILTNSGQTLSFVVRSSPQEEEQIQKFNNDIKIEENSNMPDVIVKKSSPSFIIQAEMANKNTQTKQNKESPVKQQHIKWNYTMLMYLQLLCMNLQAKLERIQLTGIKSDKKLQKADDFQDLIEMIERIHKNKNLKSLMRNLMKEIPQYFNFQNVSIMFHDEEKDQLYTIAFGDEEDQAQLSMMQKKNATSKQEIELIEAIDGMKELIMSQGQMILFPVTTGITSTVYKSQKSWYLNSSPTQNIYFKPEIDNISGVQKINNILICNTTREDGSTNGIIQLFNHPIPITPILQTKLDSIGRFFGACIQNTEEITKKTTTTLAIQLDDANHITYLNQSELIRKENEVVFQSVNKIFEKVDLELQNNEISNLRIIDE